MEGEAANKEIRNLISFLLHFVWLAFPSCKIFFAIFCAASELMGLDAEKHLDKRT